MVIIKGDAWSLDPIIPKPYRVIEGTRSSENGSSEHPGPGATEVRCAERLEA